MIQPTSGPFTLSGPTLTAESDAFLAAVAYQIDPIAQVVTVTCKMGSGTTAAGKETSFTPGPQAPSPLTIQFNAQTASWSASSGSFNQSGALNAAAVTAVLGIIAGVVAAAKNAAEAFIAANLPQFAGTVFAK